MSFLPWYFCFVSFGLFVLSRILTNRYLRLNESEAVTVGMQPGMVPPWVSALHIVGGLGLLVTGLWSFTIAWWAPAPVIVAFVLQAVWTPSEMLRVNVESQALKAKAAVYEAVDQIHIVRDKLQSSVPNARQDAAFAVSLVRMTETLDTANAALRAIRDPERKAGLLMFLNVEIERIQPMLDSLEQ